MSHYLKKESPYLGAWDLWSDPDNAYFEVEVTITHIVDKKVKDLVGKKEGMFAYFSDPKLKQMLLNVTNRKAIFAVVKDKNINNWKNVPMTIFVQQNISSPQGSVDGLRLKRTPPSHQQTELVEQAVQSSIKLLEACKDLEGLRACFSGLANSKDIRVRSKADELKIKLTGNE